MHETKATKPLPTVGMAVTWEAFEDPQNRDFVKTMRTRHGHTGLITLTVSPQPTLGGRIVTLAKNRVPIVDTWRRDMGTPRPKGSQKVVLDFNWCYLRPV